MARPSIRVAVVMERRAFDSPWQSEKWQPVRIIPDVGEGECAPRLLIEDAEHAQWVHPGFVVTLYRDEAEGYYLNVTTPTPYAFVMWREEAGRAIPETVTLSYNEAGRMLDAGEQVEGVPLPREIVEWLGSFVAEHFRPAAKTRARPPSFKGARRDER